MNNNLINSNLASDTAFMPSNFVTNEDGTENIILSTEDRVAIQQYLQEGMYLPTTNEQLINEYGLTQNMLSKYDLIKNEYAKIKISCTSFYHGAYTSSINLANQILDFNDNFYPSIEAISDLYKSYINKQMTESELRSIFNELIGELRKVIGGYIDTCTSVKDGINTFLTETNQYKVDLVGQDGKSGIVKKYFDDYNLNTEEINKLRKDIAAATKDLQIATKEYEHDIAKERETAYYSWIPIYGLIASAIVNGIYGNAAKKAAKKMDELSKKIKEETQQMNEKMALAACMDRSDRFITQLSKRMEDAIKPIEKMKSAWNALSGDLEMLQQKVNADISQLKIVTEYVKMEAIKTNWERISKEANDYRNSAFITIVPKLLAQNNVIKFTPKRKKNA